MSLTDRAIINIKPAATAKKHFDGGGLYLYVPPTGKKYWKLAYRFQHKPKTLSIGTYPHTTLKQARERREEAKELLERGLDPGVEKANGLSGQNAAQNTFQVVAEEWFAKFGAGWSKRYSTLTRRRMENHLFPYIGKMPIDQIDPAKLLETVQIVENKGALESAHRVMQIASRVYEYAIGTRKAKHNIAADIHNAIAPAKSEHYATIIEPKRVGQLLRAIDSYRGQITVEYALKLSPLVFVRPSELRCAVWDEFILEDAEWRIPKERMKMGVPHIVPLARQAVALLKVLHGATGTGKYLFPSIRSTERPMSDNTVNAALRLLGYSKQDMTGHGFRSMASTLLNELGYNRDHIERQLAHSDGSIRGTYNFAEYLPERRVMMQEWADYLDQLRSKIN